MSRLSAVVAALCLVALVATGCGGTGPGPALPAKDGNIITESPSLEQLRADLAAAGKPLPDFMADGLIEPSELRGDVMTPAGYMGVCTLHNWYLSRQCIAHRTQWYECSLQDVDYPTDVSVADKGGDPDLYVFTPMRGVSLDPANSLKLIGYSCSSSADEHVGSFYPRDWDGKGRFIAAVYAFGSSNATFDIRWW